MGAGMESDRFPVDTAQLETEKSYPEAKTPEMPMNSERHSSSFSRDKC